MKKFIKENWFKIIIILLLFLLSVVVIEVSDCDCFDSFKFFVGFVNKNLSGIVFLIFLLYFIYYFIHYGFRNYFTMWKYKRENNGNDKKYIVKFCKEEEVRKHIYLVKKSFKGGEDKIYRHIVNGYTFDKLGYPVPSKDDKDCLEISDGYEIGDEIKIYNIISDINNILNIKNNI